jgi:hypothetical protein
MSHYDNCRPGYCAACGAGPGNTTCVGGKGDACRHAPVVTERELQAARRHAARKRAKVKRT